MIKYLCDCCGAEMETWYTAQFTAHSEQDSYGRGNFECAANNVQSIFEPHKIYCKQCIDRAKEVLMQQA